MSSRVVGSIGRADRRAPSSLDPAARTPTSTTAARAAAPATAPVSSRREAWRETAEVSGPGMARPTLPGSGPLDPSLARLGVPGADHEVVGRDREEDRKSTRLNSSHVRISYAVFCLKKKIRGV